MAADQILEAIQNPAPSILQYLDVLNRQFGVEMASGDLGAQYGTITAARRPSKPFIIGLIPPDNPINFVPIQRLAGQEPQNVQPVDKTKSSVSGKAQLLPGIKPSTGNFGKQSLKRTTVDGIKLRKDIYESYHELTGQYPSEETLKLIYCQIVSENGAPLNSNSFKTNNYNLGNSHAGGHSGKYDQDYLTNIVGGGSKPTKQQINNMYYSDQTAGIDPGSGFAEPGSGTYYVGTDYRGDGTPYATTFHAFQDQKSAAKFQVAMLLQNWPDAASATNSKDFIDGLLPGPGKNYFEASRSTYERALQVRGDAYDHMFNSPVADVANGDLTAKPDVSAPQTNGLVMSYGGFSGTEQDSADDDRIGRGISPSDRRLDIAAKQTQALQLQLAAVRATPPLIFLVNPRDFSRSYEQAVDAGVKGRYRNIVQAWAERPMSITCSGVSAGQYVVDAEGNGGLTSGLRIHSLSYQALMSLVLIYKNNGVIYSGPESDEGLPFLPMSVFIYFDNHIYIGSFDSFDIDDDSDKAHNMSYGFKFTSRYDLEMTGSNAVDESSIVRSLS